MTKKKLFITGGHVTPAMAVIKEIKRQQLPWEIVFVGRTYALEADHHVSAEYRLAKDHGWKFLPLVTGRLHRDGLLKLIRSFLKLPVGVVQAFVYCMRERPDIILSFGGYIAAPVALAGYCLRIPIVTHEQTIVPGRANRFIGKLAQTICLTFPDTRQVFPKQKTVVTGLPLRDSLFHPPAHAPFTLPGSKPLLYITGGSTGAVSLNNLVFGVLPQLLEKFAIVHQTGDVSLEVAQQVKKKLEKELSDRYVPVSYIDASAVSWMLHNAHIVLGRSGANTVVELAVLGQVAVFVPLPWSGEGEQEANAQWLAEYGGARVISQSTATSEILLEALLSTSAAHDTYKKQAISFAKTIPRDGAAQVVNILTSING